MRRCVGSPYRHTPHSRHVPTVFRPNAQRRIKLWKHLHDVDFKGEVFLTFTRSCSSIRRLLKKQTENVWLSCQSSVPTPNGKLWKHLHDVDFKEQVFLTFTRFRSSIRELLKNKLTMFGCSVSLPIQRPTTNKVVKTSSRRRFQRSFSYFHAILLINP